MGVLALAQAISVFLVVLFLAYLATIVVPYLRREPHPPGDPDGFDWHFLVPCRDEEAVIGHTIAALRRDFPVGHVWVVDDASTDRTAAVVSEAVEASDRVHLIQRRLPDARTGKGDALNAAYRRLGAYLLPVADRSQVIVGVIDADGVLAPGALAQIAGPAGFSCPDVGAVQIAVQMSNRDSAGRLPRGGKGAARWFSRYLIRMQDLEFRTVIAAMQTLRMRTGSVGMGGNGQFTRMSVLDEIAVRYGYPWDDALLEDYELGLRVLLTGHRNIYCHDTYVAQEAVCSLRRLLAQRTRWSQGSIQCARYIPQILRSEHLSNAGAIESLYFLLLPFLQLLGLVVWPAVYLAFSLPFIAGGHQAPGDPAGLSWLLILIAGLGIVPFVLWGPIYRRRCAPAAPWWRGIAWGLGLWLYVYYMYVCVARAFVRVVIRRRGWVKTPRNGAPVHGGLLQEAGRGAGRP